MTEQRCPSCGRQLGDLVKTTYQGNLVVVRYEVTGPGGELTQLEHRCGDHPVVAPDR